MQADERIGVKPLPADAVPPINQSHSHVGVVDQRVRERHAHRTRPDELRSFGIATSSVPARVSKSRGR